jgi:glycosyltransferase involved in cell wall biosynthesis
MQIAVVHDYFTQMGGAERVAEELARMLPKASLHTTVALPDLMPPGLVGRQVETSWMQNLPRMKQYYRLYFILYPLAVRSLDLSHYDLVISSSSGYAKGVRTNRDAIHVCYCHTPMRWAWNFDSYSARETMGIAKRLLLPPMIRALRKWDEGASRYPDHFVANSKTVAARIKLAYGRTAEVIHPPIDINRFQPSPEQEDYYLVLSRLISYKRIDLAIEACSLLGRRLLVIGDGPDLNRLVAKAGPTVKFLSRLSDNEVGTTRPAAAPLSSLAKRTLVWRRSKSQPQAGLPSPTAPEDPLRRLSTASPVSSLTARSRAIWPGRSSVSSIWSGQLRSCVATLKASESTSSKRASGSS